jgi:hypothetical protein
MRLTYKAASRCGIPQFGLESFYNRPIARGMQLAFPDVRRWLMLGLVDSLRPAPCSWGREVVPMLLPPVGGVDPKERHGIVVMGYDRATIETAFEILRLLRPPQTVDVFLVGSPGTLLAGLNLAELPHTIRLHRDAPEPDLYGAVARSRLVLAKSGFTQVVESVSLGASVVARMVPGGIRSFMVPGAARRHVLLLENTRGVPAAMPRIVDLLNHPHGASIGHADVPGLDPVRYAAGRLEAMIDAR